MLKTGACLRRSIFTHTTKISSLNILSKARNIICLMIHIIITTQKFRAPPQHPSPKTPQVLKSKKILEQLLGTSLPKLKFSFFPTSQQNQFCCAHWKRIHNNTSSQMTSKLRRINVNTRSGRHINVVLRLSACLDVFCADIRN